MPEGTHWEWRGFGKLPDHLQPQFELLPLVYPETPWDTPTDKYMWIPKCSINVKVRKGGKQQGLKLKRFVRREGDLELWFEDKKELYPFNIDIKTLRKVAGQLSVVLRNIPEPPFDEDKILQMFQEASPKASVIIVKKERQTRKHSETVQIELAKILSVTIDGSALPLDPELSSVAVENSTDVTDAPTNQVAAARDEVDSAVSSLNLRNVGLEVKNYLQAVGDWVSTKRKTPDRTDSGAEESVVRSA